MNLLPKRRISLQIGIVFVTILIGLRRNAVMFNAQVFAGWQQQRSLQPAAITPAVEALPFAIKNGPISPPMLQADTDTNDRRNNTKTLVVVMGGLRGGETAWQSLKQNVLDVNSADLALLIEKEHNYPNASLLRIAKYHWTVPRYDDWADALDLIAGPGSADWRHDFFQFWKPTSHNILFGPLNQTYGSALIIFVHRWFLAQILKDETLELLQRYDRFVITRADHFYLCEHNLNDLAGIDADAVWVPTGSDYGGTCDRHVVASRRHVLAAIDMIPPILRNPRKYNDSLSHPKSNSERMVKRRWAEEGLSVKRFSRMLFVCAIPGDPTREKLSAEMRIKQGVYLRKQYEDEYWKSVHTCYSPGSQKTMSE